MSTQTRPGGVLRAVELGILDRLSQLGANLFQDSGCIIFILMAKVSGSEGHLTGIAVAILHFLGNCATVFYKPPSRVGL